MKKDDKPIANPWVVPREEFDDWAILFDPDTGRGFGLNPTGVLVWKLLDGEHDLNVLVNEIRQRADDVPDDAADHIVSFVDVLVAQGLAGFDRNMCGIASGTETEGRSPAALTYTSGRGAYSDAFRYQPPCLVDLSGAQAAHGSCSASGSHASGCGQGSG